MEERLEISLLLDYYSELLTDKQKDITDLYYNQDLSLSEISEITNTSRQAVHDTLKRCHHTLEGYEAKLKLMKKSLRAQQNKKLVVSLLNELENDIENKSHICIIEKIKQYINEI